MAEPDRVEPYLVRLRPNGAYLAFLTLCLIGLGFGISIDGVIRVIIIASSGLVVVMVVVPVIVSTLLRLPVLVIDGDGLRFPLMDVRLAGIAVLRVRESLEPKRRALLIVPADPSAVLSQMRPWLRPEGRSNIARYGTPIVLTSASMSRTVDETQAAIARLRPISVADPATPESLRSQASTTGPWPCRHSAVRRTRRPVVIGVTSTE